VIEVGKALELRLRVGYQGRLWVRSKQLIATVAKPLERVGPFQAVKIADAAAPIGEVDVVLGSAVSQRVLP